MENRKQSYQLFSETSEKALERYLVERVKAAGGLSLKFHSQWQTGFPDRIVMLPGGATAWVELKSKGKKPDRLQLIRHGELKALGQRVHVADSREKVDEIIRELQDEI